MKEREISAFSDNPPDPPVPPLSLGLWPMSLVCALVLAPVTFTAIQLAPQLAENPLHAAAFAAVAGVLVFLAMFVLAISLQRRAALTSPAPPAHATVTPIARLQAKDAARDERRARMASLIAEIRTQSRMATGPGPGRSDMAAAITKRLASLSTDSAHCASRAAEFLAAADLSTAKAEQGARRLAALDHGGDAPDEAVEAGKAVAQAGEAIRNLARRSDEILEIIDLIETVAAQTSLLSLNAALDAVRAGVEAGSFAGVARDLGSMAGQSSRATDRVASNAACVRQAIAAASVSMAALAECIDALETSGQERPAGRDANDASVESMAGSRNELRASLRQGMEAIGRLGILAEEAGRSVAGVADALADIVLTAHHRTVVVGEFGEDRAT